MTFKRKARVKSLDDFQACLKINKKSVTAKQLLLLFHRICVIKSGEHRLQKRLSYELAPIPLSIFDEDGMRKNEKSKLFAHFERIADFENFDNCLFVIDGGFLLHKGVWQNNETFGETAQRYINYVKFRYPNSMVVFDGYDNSTKDPERLRRSTFIVPNITIEEQNKWKINQQKTLSNTYNKKQFINLLKKY